MLVADLHVELLVLLSKYSHHCHLLFVNKDVFGKEQIVVSSIIMQQKSENKIRLQIFLMSVQVTFKDKIIKIEGGYHLFFFLFFFTYIWILMLI